MTGAMAESNSTTKRTRYCEHCDEELSYPVYKKHKERFYDKVTQTWIRNVSTNDFIDKFDAEDDEIILAAINVGMYQLC